MSGDPRAAVYADYPICPRCGGQLVDAGPDRFAARPRCPKCGLGVIAGE